MGVPARPRVLAGLRLRGLPAAETELGPALEPQIERRVEIRGNRGIGEQTIPDLPAS